MRYAVNAKAVYSLPDESADTRVEVNLLNWARWMKTEVLTEGAPSEACGCIGGGYSASFDDLVDAVDVQTAMVTDALIRDLTASQQAAIHHVYLHAVYRFRDFEKILESARRDLKLSLDARGIY